MDLSSINQKVPPAGQRTQIQAMGAINRELGLLPGSQFLAHAQEVVQATPEERVALIKSIDMRLAQLNKRSSAPATKALIHELLEQKNFLQKSEVNLVTLKINPRFLTDPAAGRATTLLSYTNQPVHTGQTLLLRFTGESQLQLLRPLTHAQLNSLLQTLDVNGFDIAETGVDSKSAANTSTLSSPNSLASGKGTAMQLAKLDINSLMDISDAAGLSKQVKANEAREAAGQILRNLLPQKDSGLDLLASLPKIAQFIQHMPMAQRREWLPGTIQDALKTIANQIRMSDQLANPKLLASAMGNSGLAFEAKLAALLASPSANSLLTQRSEAVTRPTDVTPLIHGENTQPTQPAPEGTSAGIAKIIRQDLKGGLSNLLHQLHAELEKLAQPPSVEPSKNAATTLPQFLAFLANRQQAELTHKQLRSQLLQLMHQYTLGSLAKIQLQQIHSVNHQLTQLDMPQPTQSWQLEIPVRQGADVTPLQIQVDQHWVSDESGAPESQVTRVRQWTVMLNFDLPVVGKFFAQLGLLGDTLSAKFWAEHEETLRHAQERLASLQRKLTDEGINVTSMQCVPGMPPKPKMSLSYSLVDVKT